MTTKDPNGAATLGERLHFIQLDAAACDRILKLKANIERHLPIALDKFYEVLRGAPQLRKFFESDQHMARAKSAQLGHWGSISSGQFDDHYAGNVRKIGQTHARIGLEPRWYIGGYSVIAAHLVSSIVAELWPKKLIQIRGQDKGGEVGQALGALIKGVFLDMDLSISTYLELAEEARRRDAELLDKERARVAQAIAGGLSKLAEKDLTHRMNDDLPDAYRKVQADFNAALEQLARAFKLVAATTTTLNSGAREIADAANDLSRRTEQQASSLEETAAALDELTTTVNKTAEGAKHAREVVSSARVDARNGGETVRQATDAMNKIERSSQQINQIIGVIDEIAFQTNLLALNAGVEAARAGDAGRGFAVVASEVRALAQRSAEAAKEIKGLISTSASEVSEGVALVAQTGKALERIEAKVQEINNVVAEIASSAQEQATGLSEINSAVSQMDQVTQQNAAMSEQASASSQSLAQESDQLSQLVRQFDIGETAEDPIRAELKRVAPHAFAERRARPPVEKAKPSASDVSPGKGRAAAPAPVKIARSRQATAAQLAEDVWQEF